MSSRREEKERLREQRLAEQAHEESAERRRLMAGYVLAGLLTLAVLVGLVVVIANSGGGGEGDTGCSEAAAIDPVSGDFEGLECDERDGTEPPEIELGDLKASADAAGCDLRENLPDEGNSHLSPSDPVPKYKTNPPTSGDHIDVGLQTADGAYLETPEPTRPTHSLEHGRIAIQYDPKLPEDQQLLLKGVFDDDPDGMLLFPNPDMPYAVAATAWTQLLGCKEFSDGALDAIRNFRDTYRGQGPEAVPL